MSRGHLIEFELEKNETVQRLGRQLAWHMHPAGLSALSSRHLRNFATLRNFLCVYFGLADQNQPNYCKLGCAHHGIVQKLERRNTYISIALNVG